MFGQERLDAVGAQSAPMHVGEQRVRMVTRRFLQPGFESAARERGQWRTSLLPSLADTSQMGPDAEMDGIPVEIDQFGKAQAGLDCEQQQRVIAASKPCCAIGGGQKRFDLRSRQEMYLTLVMAFRVGLSGKGRVCQSPTFCNRVRQITKFAGLSPARTGNANPDRPQALDA